MAFLYISLFVFFPTSLVNPFCMSPFSAFISFRRPFCKRWRDHHLIYSLNSSFMAL